MVVSSNAEQKAAILFFKGLDWDGDLIDFDFPVQGQVEADNVSLLLLADEADKTKEPLLTVLPLARQKNIPIVTLATMVEVGEAIGWNEPAKIASLNKGKSYIGTVINTLNQAVDAPKEEREP
ncbi:unnamed protein product [Arabidopsis arenosa]|uniref:50S ribosomal protein L30e-like n=2 Tax=Arabidopsis TaxID=3701 RepID=A0A8T1XCV0_9BRAS|nr:50S ribosomal protein L30e-like [Arabidopsis thaliana x Arabidopsis arenosa]CAE6213281.1 unnamed protein product [Arabidopsis arenosa]